MVCDKIYYSLIVDDHNLVSFALLYYRCLAASSKANCLLTHNSKLTETRQQCAYALCFRCNKIIDINSMCKTATSHSKSQKHVQLLNASTIGGQSSIGAFVSEKYVPSSSTGVKK